MKKFLLLFALSLIFAACKSDSSTEPQEIVEATIWYEHINVPDYSSESSDRYVTCRFDSDSGYVVYNNKTYSIATNYKNYGSGKLKLQVPKGTKIYAYRYSCDTTFRYRHTPQETKVFTKTKKDIQFNIVSTSDYPIP